MALKIDMKKPNLNNPRIFCNYDSLKNLDYEMKTIISARDISSNSALELLCRERIARLCSREVNN